MTLDPQMVALRRERDALLLKDRGTKATTAWKTRYRAVTRELNTRADISRAERWSAAKKEAR